MLFNSLTFGVFLPIVLILFWRARGAARLWVLLLASYIFYMWNNPWFIFLLVGLTVVNYYAAAFMVAGGRRRGWVLALAIIIDLASIGIFKYADFAIRTSNFAARHLDFLPSLPYAHIYLPLGISFFTFQMMSYVVDVWRGQPPERKIRNFALYVAFFPQLVAGPIMRSGDLIPQFRTERRFNPRLFRTGLFFLTMGMVKKVVFADNLGAYATRVFDDPESFNTLSNLSAVYAYAFQIYFDFSGYTDIAIGCGRMMGFEIMTNFNLPYLAHNMRDFWRRWHISLSTWLRDYLYIPLGGSRNGRGATYRNLMITMALGGLWHGAAWKFVIWGTYHGVLLAANRARTALFGSPREREVKLLGLRWWAGALVTFHLVCMGWIFFRADDMATVGAMFARLGALDFTGEFAGKYAMIGVALGAASHIANGRWNLRRAFLRSPALVQMAFYAAAVLLLALFSVEEKAFIYFQF